MSIIIEIIPTEPLKLEDLPPSEYLDGLHVAALDYAGHPDVGSRRAARMLTIAGLQSAVTYLASTGESGTAVAVLILAQRIEDLTGAYLEDLIDPEDTGKSGLPLLCFDVPDPDETFGPDVTMPFYGARR